MQTQTQPRVLVSTLQNSLADVYEDWTDEFGIGPCGAMAAFLREQGYGDVAVCTAHDGDADELGFTHYIILSDGDIIDLANPFDDDSLIYRDIEVLDSDEMPECIGEVEVEWMRQRITLMA